MRRLDLLTVITEALDEIKEKCKNCQKCPLGATRTHLLRNDSREKGSPKWLMWQDIQEIKKAYDALTN